MENGQTTLKTLQELQHSMTVDVWEEASEPRAKISVVCHCLSEQLTFTNATIHIVMRMEWLCNPHTSRITAP